MLCWFQLQSLSATTVYEVGVSTVIQLWNQFVSTMRNRVFGHMRTAKAQVSLRIRVVWPGPPLSANRIIWSTQSKIREQRPKWYLAHAQDDLNLGILRMFEGPFSLGAAHLVKNRMYFYVYLRIRHNHASPINCTVSNNLHYQPGDSLRKQCQGGR